MKRTNEIATDAVRTVVHEATNKAADADATFAAYKQRRHFLQSTAGLFAAIALGMSGKGWAATNPLKIVALGDSLTAGYLLPAQAAFPVVLEKALRNQGYDVRLINAGVSGDTAAGGLARLDWSLGEGVDGVIVELGANDMLRGIDPASTRATLAEILTRLRQRRIKALLAGMRAAPNLDALYREQFEAIYPALAQQFDVPFYPFFLDGVAGNPALELPDRVHPNQEGVERIVEKFLPLAERFVQSLGS